MLIWLSSTRVESPLLPGFWGQKKKKVHYDLGAESTLFKEVFLLFLLLMYILAGRCTGVLAGKKYRSRMEKKREGKLKKKPE